MYHRPKIVNQGPLRLNGYHLGPPLLACVPPRRFGPRTTGDPMSNSVKPAGEPFPFADGGSPPDQHEKRGLKGILRIVRIPQQLPANGQHHRPVAGQNLFEGCLVVLVDEALQDFPISDADRSGPAHEGANVPKNIGKCWRSHPDGTSSGLPLFCTKWRRRHDFLEFS
jgi:hypothetical protein